MTEQTYRVIGGRLVLRALELQGKIYHVRLRDRRTGRIITRTTRCRRRRAAEAAATAIGEQVLAELEGTRLEPITVAAAFSDWLRVKPARETTRRDQRSVFNTLLPHLGNLQVADVTPGDLEQAFRALGADRRPTTLRKYRTILRAFWAWSRRHRFASEDPTAGLALPRGDARLGQALTLDEARRLLAACRYRGAPAHLHLAVLIALHAGLRKQNVLGLHWTQVDGEHRRITIGADEMKAGRGHTVPIHPELVTALRVHGTTGLLGDGPVPRYVLGHRVKEILGPFRTALRRAELPPLVRWHDLRHTASTWWQARHPLAIAERLAGRRLGGEAGTYGHLSWDDLLAAVDAMPWIETPTRAAARRQA